MIPAAIALALIGFVQSLGLVALVAAIFFAFYFFAYEPYRAMYPDLLDEDRVAGRAQSTQAVARGLGTRRRSRSRWFAPAAHTEPPSTASSASGRRAGRGRGQAERSARRSFAGPPSSRAARCRGGRRRPAAVRAAAATRLAQARGSGPRARRRPRARTARSPALHFLRSPLPHRAPRRSGSCRRCAHARGRGSSPRRARRRSARPWPSRGPGPAGSAAGSRTNR